MIKTKPPHMGKPLEARKVTVTQHRRVACPSLPHTSIHTILSSKGKQERVETLIGSLCKATPSSGSRIWRIREVIWPTRWPFSEKKGG